MANYLLFLYDDPSQWAKLSPDEMQAALEKYMAWGRNAFVRGGERLADDTGKVIRSENGQGRAADGPYSETKEILGGFYTIEAASYEEAVQRSLDHPHVLYGGTIEIRKVWE